MKKSRTQLLIVAVIALAGFVAPAQAAADDDFGRIVKHIETQYHVHRQHRWVMGFAGFVVKMSHFSGVKSLKGAIFENQRFLNANGDTEFEQVVRQAADSGWQPMVQSWDRHSGERTYIYAHDAGRDMTVLLVTLEPNEAVVLQLKLDPQKFSEFAHDATTRRHHRSYSTPDETQPDPIVEAASSSPQDWDGVCLLVDEPKSPSQP